MFYVFETSIQTWDKNLIQAKLLGTPPETQPYWWDCKPLDQPLPLITFSVRENCPLPDNLFTGSIFNLYSIKLLDLLSKTNRVKFETFPLRFVDQMTQKELKTEHKIFHLLEKYPIVDYDQSDISDDELEIRELIINNQSVHFNNHLFRIEGLDGIVLIHRELKELLELHGITGCLFTPVEEYRSGIRFYFDQFRNGDE